MEFRNGALSWRAARGAANEREARRAPRQVEFAEERCETRRVRAVFQMAVLLLSYVHGSVTAQSQFRPLCQVDSRSCVRGGSPASCSVAKKKYLAHPTSTGFWEVDSNYAYYLDTRLADALIRFLREPVTNTTSDVLELGAGMGCYTQYLASRGVPIRAYDGSPTVAERTDGLVQAADLSRRQSLGYRADWVFCIEVAEHIPPQFEDALLSNLDEHNRKGLVLSWSSLKPPHGNGHVNLRVDEVGPRRPPPLGSSAPTPRQHARSGCSLCS